MDHFETHRKSNRLLDVGCGIGLFLEMAKERSWEVYGTEFSDRAVAICAEKGISMQQGPLDSRNYEPGTFDVVTSFEVIEHLNNPVQVVGNMAAILQPKGLLYLTTPNFNSLSRDVLKQEWNVIGYPEHLAYYTPSTMKSLLKRQGFSHISIRTTGWSLTRFRTSRKLSAQPFVSAKSDDAKLRTVPEGNRIIRTGKQLVNSLLTWAGKGDTLKVFARKPHNS